MSKATLIQRANSAIIRDSRTGSKETCTDSNNGEKLACTLKLYRNAKGTKRDNLLIATVSSHIVADDSTINYVPVESLTDDSLIVFQLDIHNVASSDDLTGRLAQANNRQVRIKDTFLLAVDSDSVYVIGQEESHDIAIHGVTIGNKWIDSRINRLLKKGKRTQWKQTRTNEGDSVVYGFDFDLD